LPISDPKIKIRDVLTAAWNNTATDGKAPRIHTGWFNAKYSSTPQVTVTHPFEYTHQGGVTGFRAFSGNGDLVRNVIVDLTVTCWGTHEMTSNNGKDLIEDMSTEVRRILDVNRTSDAELEWMAWLGKTEPTPDTQADPILFKQQNDVRLYYREVV
jgi:hypothetical protein